MRGLIIYLCLFTLAPLLLLAQKARYSVAELGNEPRIAGIFGNSIHVWSISKKNRNIFHETTTLNLHIYSPALTLIGQRKFQFGESILRSIDFQSADSFYYTSINYITDANKRLMLRIDPSGGFIDVSGEANIWRGNRLPGLQGLNAISVNTDNFYAIKTDNSDSNNSIFSREPVVLTEEPPKANIPYEKIILRKASRHTQQLVAEKSYASRYLTFSRLLINASDTSVLACSFADPKKGIAKNPYRGSYLFITKLDTNLAETGSGHVLLKNSKGPPNEIFSPSSILPVGNTLLVISAGLYSKPSFSYYRDNRTGLTGAIPQVFNSYITSSLRISQTDENNQLLLDTVIRGNAGREHMQWENRYVLLNSKEVLLFFIHQYAANRTGITLLRVDHKGKMFEKDLIVNEKYAYSLTDAARLAPGMLLVPYTYKRKKGLMRLNYTDIDAE